MKKLNSPKTEKYVTMSIFERAMASIARSFTGMEKRFDKIDQRFNRIDQKLTQHDDAFATLIKMHPEHQAVYYLRLKYVDKV